MARTPWTLLVCLMELQPNQGFTLFCHSQICMGFISKSGKFLSCLVLLQRFQSCADLGAQCFSDLGVRHLSCVFIKVPPSGPGLGLWKEGAGVGSGAGRKGRSHRKDELHSPTITPLTLYPGHFLFEETLNFTSLSFFA